MWHVWNVNPAFTKDGKREIRRRRREALSCERCRRLKVRCDRRLPCGHCQRSKRDDQCHYLSKAAQDPKAAKETPEKRLKATQQDETKSSPDIASVNDASVAETSTSSGSPRQMSPQSVPSPLVENPGALLPFHALSDDQAAARVSDSDLLMRRAGRTYKQPFSSRFRLWNSKYRGETHWLVFVNEVRNAPLDRFVLERNMLTISDVLVCLCVCRVSKTPGQLVVSDSPSSYLRRRYNELQQVTPPKNIPSGVYFGYRPDSNGSRWLY